MFDSESIDDFAGRLSGLASKSAALGEVIDETKIVKKFFKSLSRAKFTHIVAPLEYVLDLKIVGFEDVVGRLKSYEERIKEEDVNDGNQTRVMFVKSSGGVVVVCLVLMVGRKERGWKRGLNSPIRILTQKRIKPRRTDPNLFFIGVIKQATSHTNVRIESKNYKKVILSKVRITM